MREYLSLVANVTILPSYVKLLPRRMLANFAVLALEPNFQICSASGEGIFGSYNSA